MTFSIDFGTYTSAIKQLRIFVLIGIIDENTEINILMTYQKIICNIFVIFSILFNTIAYSCDAEDFQGGRISAHVPHYISPMEDVAFERLMEVNLDNLEEKRQVISLLKALSGVQITDIEEFKTQAHTSTMQDRRAQREHRKKYGFMDYMCKTPEGYQLIEVQVRPEEEWDRRAVFYAARTYIQGVTSGVSFAELKDVVAINILGFRKKPRLPVGKYKRDFRLHDVENAELFEDYIDAFRIIQYEVPQITPELLERLPSDPYNGGEKEWWSLFTMKRREEHSRLPSSVAGIVKEAASRLEQSTWTEEQKEAHATLVRQEELDEKALEEREAKGKIEGDIARAITTAFNQWNDPDISTWNIDKKTRFCLSADSLTEDNKQQFVQMMNQDKSLEEILASFFPVTDEMGM